MATTPKATWTKIKKTNTWGVKVRSTDVEAGDKITVTKRSGETSETWLKECVWQNGEVSIWTIDPTGGKPSIYLSRPQGRSPFFRGEVLLVDEDLIERASEHQGVDLGQYPTYTAPGGKTYGVLKCVRSHSWSNDMVEEMDAWHEQHSGTFIAATPEVSASVIEKRRERDEKREAKRRELEERRSAYRNAVEWAEAQGTKCSSTQFLPEHTTEVVWSGLPREAGHVTGYFQVRKLVFEDGSEGAMHCYGNASLAYVPQHIAEQAWNAYAEKYDITVEKAREVLDRHSTPCYGDDVYEHVVATA